MKNIFKIPAYVGIILKKDNSVLLVQRHSSSTWMPHYWNFPGGLLEENESLTMAAARETHEEVEVSVMPSDFTFAHMIHVHANISKKSDGILGCYFITEQWTGIPQNGEPDKHSDVAWFDLDNLPERITEHALLAIESIKSGKKYHEDGW